jgi:3'-phosphoadenosine 5'-phosphosulfate sulfotransferase (PAPS reductase)/FAD synthetase
VIEILSMSGGKDSVAMWLYARRLGLRPVVVYCDTGWEAPEHYQYLDYLEDRIGPFVRLSGPRTMAELIQHKGTFPSRVRRFCTEELKLKPMARYIRRFGEYVVWTGERHAESRRRAGLPTSEFSRLYNCQIYRPILTWSVDDVWSELDASSIEPHPLYGHGCTRVGCWPCINATKAELRLVAQLSPNRVDEIRVLEQNIGQTMFCQDRRTEKRRTGCGPSVVPISIDQKIAWAMGK